MHFHVLGSLHHVHNKNSGLPLYVLQAPCMIVSKKQASMFPKAREASLWGGQRASNVKRSAQNFQATIYFWRILFYILEVQIIS